MGSYAPDQILVRYAPARPALRARAASAHEAANETEAPGARTRLLRLAHGVSVPAALARLRRRPGVLWAVPDYRAHTAGVFIPNDPGVGGAPTDWEQLQWNFVGPFGVNAPEAWANVAADGHPGGRGVVVAVLDTGVAYANRGRFRRSPGLQPLRVRQRLRLHRARPLPQRPQRSRHVRRRDDRRVDEQPLRPHRPRLRRAPDARARAQQPGRRRRLDDRRRRALRRQPSAPR